MKFNIKKCLPAIIKISSCAMAFAGVIVTLSQNSTCLALYHQPEVPKSLLKKGKTE